MSSRVLAFEQRAARLLESDEPPKVEALDALITDGCAEALNLETEMRRLARRREALLAEVGDPATDREVVELGERHAAVRERWMRVQDGVVALMRRRARVRLGTFLAERQTGG